MERYSSEAIGERGSIKIKRIDAVYALITDETDTKILMVRNVDNGLWSLPGGAVEENEFLELAAIREAKEETGFDIKVHGIVAVNEAALLKFGEHACFFTFRAEIIGGACEISRPEEISEIKWMDVEVADHVLPYYQNRLQDIVKTGVRVMYVNQGTVS